jgi:hypothetical protein
MKYGIDYMTKELHAKIEKMQRENGNSDSFLTGYSLGWDAALEAAHARAEAKGGAERARPRYWACTGWAGYFACVGGQVTYTGTDGTHSDTTMGAVWESVHRGEATEVPTLAEARRVAGFAEETQ